MSESVDPRQQIAEIQARIAESRSTFEGGGPMPVMVAVLTTIGLALTLAGVRLPWFGVGGIWLIHNILLWTIGWWWFRWDARRTGRVSVRDRNVFKLWGGITLAVWLTAGLMALQGAGGLFVPLLGMYLGLGIFGTGLISESKFSQVLGLLQMIAGVALSAALEPPAAYVAVIASTIVSGLAWGAGGWLIVRYAK